MDISVNSNQTMRRERVIGLVAEILEIDDPRSIKPTDRLRKDLGMDSLESLELLSTISEELKLDLDMESAMGIRTIDDACAFVELHFAKQHPEG